MITKNNLALPDRTSKMWFITGPAGHQFQDRYNSFIKNSADLASFEKFQSLSLADLVGGANPPYYIVPSTTIAVVSLNGMILKNASILEQWLFGAVDIDDFVSDVTAAFNDENVTTIVLNINTPGGDTTGLQEAANKIQAMNEVKPICAFTDTLCASAGYYIASACDAIVTTNSAAIGCIGTMYLMYDTSAMFQQEGIKAILIKSGKFKGQGSDGVPITDDMIAHYQGIVDTLTQEFYSMVNSNHTVATENMQGQIFLGSQAVNNGIADQVVTDFPELIELLAA